MQIYNSPLARAITDGTGGYNLRPYVYAIGVWNMDSIETVTITHGVTSTKILSVEGVIYADNGAAGVIYQRQTSDVSDGITIYWDATTIYLYRATLGFYDSINYNDAVMNRGYIVAWVDE